MIDQTDFDPLVLTNRTTLGIRVLFACFGSAPLIWPAWELQPWNIPFGIMAIFPWIIVLGAMSLGLTIILLMVFAPNNRLTIAREGITLNRQTIFGEFHRHIDVFHIAEVALNRTEWQDGPDSFAIRVAINGTPNFVTAPIASEEQAEQLLQQTRNVLDAIRSNDQL